jgi:flagellar hook-associated protein 2
MTANITFTGLGSGTDWTKIVNQLVQVESYRITQMNTWKTTWQDKITSIQGLNSRMLSLESFVQSKNTASEFMATAATSSDENVLTASSTSTAIPGAHTIVIGSSIKHRFASDGKADQDTTVYASAGTSFQITVGSSNGTITFGSDSTLDQMVTTINDQSNLVTAEVIDDGSSSNSYRLVLTSETGGAAGKITISTNTTNTNFNMTAAQRVDSAELGSGWGGTGSVTSGGQYLGTTNKTFRFTVSGTDSKTIGTDSFDVTWTDGEGNSGTIGVTAETYTNISVYQGLTISFGDDDETIVGGDTFSVDVWHNDLQAGQDEGLARVEQEVHSGFSDSGTTAVTTAAGTFSYTYNGRSTTIDVALGTTLTELKDLINNDADNPGVTASIINDGMGLSSSYHLVLTGESTGAAYKITSISHTLDNFGATFTESQSAQNAMLKVDGYPSDTSQYIQRLSNSVSDVITGVTLSLVASGTASVSISEDIDTIRSSIETFVSSVNFVLDYIKDQTKYDSETDESGIMIGNYSYQIVRQRIADILTSSIPGLTDGVDPYTHLAQIGIKTNPDNDGKWEIESTTLNNALNTNLEGVKKLFIKDEITGVNGVLELLSQEMENLNDSDDGPMNVLIDNYEGIIDGIDTGIEREERRVALVKNRLEDQFAKLETLLGQLSGQEKYLQSLIAQLPTIGGTSSQ